MYKRQAIEPNVLSPCNKNINETKAWPQPDIVQPLSGIVRLVNPLPTPLSIKRNEHLGNVYHATTSDTFDQNVPPVLPFKPKRNSQSSYHSSSVKLDPDNILSPEMRQAFLDLIREYDEVFDPNIVGYNGAVGPHRGYCKHGASSSSPKKRAFTPVC